MYSDTASAVPAAQTAPPTPTWDPQQYLRHAGHRARPFLDLLARIPELPTRPARVVDLGCGPGRRSPPSSPALAGRPRAPATTSPRRWSSPGPRPTRRRPDFETRPPRRLAGRGAFDLIVSNAALQWVPGHARLLPDPRRALRPGGCFAFQIPGNSTRPATSCSASSRPTRASRRTPGEWRGRRRTTPTCTPGRCSTSGCAWTPGRRRTCTCSAGPTRSSPGSAAPAPAPRVLEALPDDLRADFETEYRALLARAYPPGPHGTVLPFRRIFVVAEVPA